MFLGRARGVRVVVLAFAEQSFDAFEDLFTVRLVESIMIVSKFLLKLLFLLLWYFFHVLFI